MRLALPFVAFLLIAAVLSSAAYAQQGITITVGTDQSDYKTGDTVMISGNVSKLQPSYQVVIEVFNPDNVLSRIDPVAVSEDGAFSYTYVIAGPLNQISGNYRVVATYGRISGESTFMYTSLEPRWQSYRLFVDGKSYDVLYGIQGGTANRISADFALLTLAVTIASNSNGQLMLRLPRTLVGFGAPEEFLEVFIDGTPGTIVGWKNFECQSEVTIQFDAGATVIELVGTQLAGEPIEVPSIVSYSTTVPIKAEGEQLDLQTRMNADSCDFSFSPEKKQLHVDLVGPSGSQGYFEITLSHRFLGGPYVVLLNNVTTIEYNATYNLAQENGEDSTTISLQYDPTLVGSINIIGTTAIPEFGHLLVAMVVTTLAGIAGTSRLIMKRF